MAKYFICSDVHGFYTEWMKALKEAGFDIENPNHKIIHCGDLLDRGEEAVKCLQFVSDLLDKNRIICIKGNHEWMFEECFKYKTYQSRDYHNGTVGTYIQLVKDLGIANNKREEIEMGYNHPLMQKYLKHCLNYYETSKYIFVHSYIPTIHIDAWMNPEKALKSGSFADFHKYNKYWRDGDEMDWYTATWQDPFMIWDEGIREPNKTIVCGHWGVYMPNHDFHGKGYITQDEFIVFGKREYCFEPFIDKQIIGLDATTSYSHKVNIVILQRDMKPVEAMNKILKEHDY